MFNNLDHIAIAVKDIDAVLPFWTKKMSLEIAAEELVANKSIRLLHLDAGGCQIQLVQPMDEEHPIAKWVKENGDGLHHLCFYVDDFDKALNFAKENHLVDNNAAPHQGTDGKRAIFLTKTGQGMFRSKSQEFNI